MIHSLDFFVVFLQFKGSINSFHPIRVVDINRNYIFALFFLLYKIGRQLEVHNHFIKATLKIQKFLCFFIASTKRDFIVIFNVSTIYGVNFK